MTSADTDRRQATGSTRRRPARTTWDRVRAGLSLGVVLGLGATGTMAAWTDTATAESGLFGAADVELTINGESPEFAFASVEDVMPGQSVAGNLLLANEGGVDLRYLMNMKVVGLTNAEVGTGQQRGDATSLGNNLTLTVHEGATADGETTCPGELLKTQRMTVGGVNADPLPVLTDYRPVAAGASDTICVQATLASNAPIQSRMAQVGVTFIVNAEVAP